MGPWVVVFWCAWGAWAFGWLLFWRLPGWSREIATPRHTVSVIIPARNEAKVLPVLLHSLRIQQPGAEEIIVVDDGSSDGTPDVARAGGARVVQAGPLPDGWRGKPWACQRGAEASRGQYLVFLDADTKLQPGGLETIIAELARIPGGVVSVVPFQHLLQVYEQLSAFFTLSMVFGTGAFSLLGGRSRRSGLFGPCLAMTRETYAAIGGHGAVKGWVLENLHLAELLHQRKAPIRLLGGRGVLDVRMYADGLRQLLAGWGKTLPEGVAQTSLPIRLAIGLWMAGTLASVALLVAAGVGLLAGSCLFWTIPYLLYAFQLLILLQRLGQFRWYTAAFFPIPLIFYLVIFGRAMTARGRGQQATWKGRSLHVD